MNKRQSKSGFSLVEVALALLVVAIGMISAFALFPTGLDLNKRAIDDAQTAMFAEEVLNGIMAKAMTSRWDSATMENIQLNPPAAEMWKNPASMRIKAKQPAKAIKYESAYSASLVVDYALFFETETDDTGPRRYFRLEASNGEFRGGQGSVTNVFYVEVFNQGL